MSAFLSEQALTFFALLLYTQLAGLAQANGRLLFTFVGEGLGTQHEKKER
jgi:hypothetical protein